MKTLNYTLDPKYAEECDDKFEISEDIAITPSIKLEELPSNNKVKK